jgi:LPXTG-motif cell wall-anchored protein
MSLTANDLGNTGGPAQVATKAVTIMVVDTTPPTITVPASPISAQTDPGQAGAHVSYIVTVTDNAQGPASVTCAPSSGSLFPIGTTTVTCTAVDGAANSSSRSFAIIVTDSEKPVIGPTADIVVAIPARATSGVATFPAPAASDNSGSVTVVCTPPSGSTFPVGVTPVVCTATDPSGNSASAGFTVTVVASSPPSTGLPATGSDVSSVWWLALIALCAGALLVVAGRRRRRA